MITTVDSVSNTNALAVAHVCQEAAKVALRRPPAELAWCKVTIDGQVLANARLRRTATRIGMAGR